MAASPHIKVFNPAGEYTAATKHYEEAAALVAFLGAGAEIRTDHAKSSVVWREGEDGNASAAESYDYVVETCVARARANSEQARQRRRERAGVA